MNTLFEEYISADTTNRSISRAHSLVGHSRGRDQKGGDFYPTPPYATQALLDQVAFKGTILEPACGNGAMSEVLKSTGCYIMSSDLYDRGYSHGCHGIDFLSNVDVPIDRIWTPSLPLNIVTNPPFCLAQEFIEKSLQIATDKVAMFLKLSFLSSARRKPMFESTPLKTVYVFSSRVQLTRSGEECKNGGMIDFCWMVWEIGYEGKPEIEWI